MATWPPNNPSGIDVSVWNKGTQDLGYAALGISGTLDIEAVKAGTLNIAQWPPVRARLRCGSGSIHIDSDHMPNWWIRFWHYVLLGWTWERVGDSSKT